MKMKLKLCQKKKKHICSLNLGSQSMLPKAAPGKSQLCRELKKTLLISELHPKGAREYHSFAEILAERQRQLIEGGNCVIHPYSPFRFFWSCLMIVVNLSHMVVVPLRFAYILEFSKITACDYLILALDCICFLDIILKFNLGYVERDGANICMIRRKIAFHYLLRWFIPDLVSCAPVAIILIPLNVSRKYVMIAHYLPLLRTAHLPSILFDLKLFMKAVTRSYIWQRGIRHIVLFLITMHWCTCLVYFPAMSYYYWNEGERNLNYCTFLGSNKDLHTYSNHTRYKKALFLSFSALFGSGYNIFSTVLSSEIMVYCVIILYTSMFMVYTVVFLIKIYLTEYSASMRYQELMNQVEKYMRHKQFSTQLKKRVRAFYNYRYQGRYFKESYVLDCLSEELCNEINLHTCHKLVNKVALFEDLPPSVVGTVLGCLKPAVYMPNDLIVRAGDIGDCMYFIASGTVAVYSLKGAEVCHLDDGNHFGEVALLMKDRKRVATVVAVEITQVYRLDAADFRDFIMTYHELFERIELLASKRMHETVLIDEAFRQSSISRSIVGDSAADITSQNSEVENKDSPSKKQDKKK